MAALEKIPVDVAVHEGLRCSFCGREPAEGSDLIGTSDVFICDECVATCNDLISDAGSGESAAVAAEDEESPANTPGPPKPAVRGLACGRARRIRRHRHL